MCDTCHSCTGDSCTHDASGNRIDPAGRVDQDQGKLRQTQGPPRSFPERIRWSASLALKASRSMSEDARHQRDCVEYGSDEVADGVREWLAGLYAGCSRLHTPVRSCPSMQLSVNDLELMHGTCTPSDSPATRRRRRNYAQKKQITLAVCIGQTVRIEKV